MRFNKHLLDLHGFGVKGCGAGALPTPGARAVPFVPHALPERGGDGGLRGPQELQPYYDATFLCSYVIIIHQIYVNMASIVIETYAMMSASVAPAMDGKISVGIEFQIGDKSYRRPTSPTLILGEPHA